MEKVTVTFENETGEKVTCTITLDREAEELNANVKFEPEIDKEARALYLSLAFNFIESLASA